MTVYVDCDYHIYTEKNIDDEIIGQLESSGYDGVFDYIITHYTQSELFKDLNPEIQKEIYNHLKEEILATGYSEHEIDVPNCPLLKDFI